MNYVNKNVEKDISFASDHLVDFTGDPPLAHSESGTLRYEDQSDFCPTNRFVKVERMERAVNDTESVPVKPLAEVLFNNQCS